jgi:hypothetical protein
MQKYVALHPGIAVESVHVEQTRGVLMRQSGFAHAGNRHSSSSGRAPVSPAAQLLSLCHTASADGALSQSESRLLRTWIERAPDDDVPAGEYVREVIEHIVETGRVAQCDLQALWRALEPDLPEELRRRAATRHLGGAYGETQEDEGESAENLPNEILSSSCFLLAGCPGERRTRHIERLARTGDPVLLVRQAGAVPSPHTVRVCAANGKRLGFVPEQHAQELAPLLDRGARYRAHLTAVLRGEHAPVVIVQAFLYSADATLGEQSAGDRRIASKESRARAWMLVRIAVGALLAAAVALVLHNPF